MVRPPYRFEWFKKFILSLQLLPVLAFQRKQPGVGEFAALILLILGCTFPPKHEQPAPEEDAAVVRTARGVEAVEGTDLRPRLAIVEIHVRVEERH